jgi:hypothetical protein
MVEDQSYLRNYWENEYQLVVARITQQLNSA